MIIKVLVTTIFCSNIIFSQDIFEKKYPIDIDSLRIAQKYILLLNYNEEDNLPLLSLSEIENPYELSFETDFIKYEYGNINYLSSFSMQNVKNEMAQTFAVYRSGQNKYYLGVVSDILGYVSTTAAAGLAAYHLYKYRKKYGLK